MPVMRVLLADDDASLGPVLARELTEHGYLVDLVCDGEAAAVYLRSNSYEVVVADGRLPRLPGPDLVRQLRQAGAAQPVLILTGPDAAQNRAAGADDVLVKPFEAGELLTRLRALQRRPPATTAPRLVLGGLELDPASGQALVGGQPVTFSAAELGILEILLRRSPAVAGPRLIARHLRDSEGEASGADLVDARLAGLRAKLAGSGVRIQTVSGFGYRIIALPDAG
jgi:DNA-binding response OmpR family regulator